MRTWFNRLLETVKDFLYTPEEESPRIVYNGPTLKFKKSLAADIAESQETDEEECH